MRTSTDDQQSPADSRRWQLDTASRLITPQGGEIVETYHDVDVSREVPWARRPEASRLLTNAATKTRAWTAVAIAEPSRAFSGGQFQLVFPQLSHYGVELWVPELGGRIDPDSEGHEMMMGLFGGLSKAERRRVQIRTHNAVLAHAAAGRWLGGRPNYGYLLVNTAQPHPQRNKAAAGICLRTLEPDPETAPIVRRIFELFDNRNGYRSIASILEREGLPSPGEIGPVRHARSAGVWAGSAVRAILCNPRYVGHQVVGRQRRADELIDPTDPALGTKSRQRWQRTDDWVSSEDQAWPALVDQALFARVNARIKNTRDPDSERQPRSEPGRYLLSGLIRCGLCGRSMHGATLKNEPYYRCIVARPDHAPTDHPRATAIREERILAGLDLWLEEITAPESRAETIQTLLDGYAKHEPEPVEVVRARQIARDSNTELDRVIAALRAGMDPQLAATTTRSIQNDQTNALALISKWEIHNKHPRPLTAEEIEDVLAHAGSLTALLRSADREPRAGIYQGLGLDLIYQEPGGDSKITARYRLLSKCGGGRI